MPVPPTRPILPALLGVLPLLVLAALLAGGCSQTEPQTGPAYERSRSALLRGSPGQAEADLPPGEGGAFIPAMERTYLNLLQGKAELAPLVPFREGAEERVRVHVSRELGSFFFLETPEGYYPSEHEIVWMHLLLSWGHALAGRREQGCVEVRQAGHLLSATWSEEGHFDDPMLRAVAGVLWALCGEWREAAVDFRRAAELDPSLDWARELGAREQPPKALFLALSGPGPEPVWNPEVQVNLLRGVRRLSFPPSAPPRAAVQATVAGTPVEFHATPGASPWYVRHLVRESVLSEVIGDYRYGLDATYESTRHAATRAGAVGVVIGATVVGIVAGAAVIYLAAEAQSGEGILLGLTIPFYALGWGLQKHDEIVAESSARFEFETNPANFYRFVRFLPEQAWLGWSDAPGPDIAASGAPLTARAVDAAGRGRPVALWPVGTPAPPERPGDSPGPQVYIGHDPGSAAAPPPPTVRGRTGTVP